ncbi:MAG TPA: HD domain-containing phosphohydrolase [Thermoanaerobaculia bacterium]|nr:HD domain-containing phosphohydrolase [Thermoanaerobaculia bacterium]
MSEPYALLLEPDSERQRTISKALGDIGAHVVTSVADSAARGEAPSFVILSALSPGGGTLDFLRAFLSDARNASVPVLALVSASEPSAADAYLSAGAHDVLPWPASEKIVSARLSSAAAVARLRREVTEFGRILNSLARALEARVPYTDGHSQRVAEIAAALSRAIGLSEKESETVRRASWIHDIGEVIIPERDPESTARLTEEEEERIRAHPLAGFQMLQGAPSLAPLLPFVRMHHERIDGSGYPDGLVGDEIPKAVQVLSIVDAYVALASPRSFRPARPHATAMQILEKEARIGNWDPVLVKALDAVVREVSPADVLDVDQ